MEKARKIFKNRRSATIFLIVILAVPTIHWFVFWLYVNMSSFVLAFKAQTGDWSLINFQLFWDSLKNPYGGTVGGAIINTLKYSGRFPSFNRHCVLYI